MKADRLQWEEINGKIREYVMYDGDKRKKAYLDIQTPLFDVYAKIHAKLSQKYGWPSFSRDIDHYEKQKKQNKRKWQNQAATTRTSSSRNPKGLSGKQYVTPRLNTRQSSVEYVASSRNQINEYWRYLQREYKENGDLIRDFTYDYLIIDYKNGDGKKESVTISEQGEFGNPDYPIEWRGTDGTVVKEISAAQLKAKDIVAIRSWISGVGRDGGGGFAETVTRGSYTADETQYGNRKEQLRYTAGRKSVTHE